MVNGNNFPQSWPKPQSRQHQFKANVIFYIVKMTTVHFPTLRRCIMTNNSEKYRYKSRLNVRHGQGADYVKQSEKIVINVKTNWG